MYLIAYCVGNVIGRGSKDHADVEADGISRPQTFRPKDAPQYGPAGITIIICWAVCFVDLGFIFGYCKQLNRQKAMVRVDPGYTKLKNLEYVVSHA